MEISFKKYLTEEQQLLFDFMRTPKVGWKEIQDKKLFGPVYHGTNEENRQKIADVGFQVFIGGSRSGNVSHGYEAQNYNKGLPAPIHHLGYGIYFTNSKSIAKNFNHNTTRGLEEYYLDIPKLATINFGSPNTMMKWWIENGYNMQPVTDWTKKEQIENERIQATIHMTNTLKAKYNAVWFKGKGIRTLLDGDQICVFDQNRIYKLDKFMHLNDEIYGPGDRVLIKGTKIIAKVKSVRFNNETVPSEWTDIIGYSNYWLTLDYKDPENLIKQRYMNPYKEALRKNHPEYLDNFEKIGRPFEEYFENRLKYNFPSALIERKLAKGERIK